jgi:hypothetical protein
MLYDMGITIIKLVNCGYLVRRIRTQNIKINKQETLNLNYR